MARPQYHSCGDVLAPVVIGDSDHSDLGDRGVFEKYILDLGRRDVLAATDDGVVGAPLDEQVAVVVDPPRSRVASQPSVVESRCATRGTRRKPADRAT